MEVVNLEAKLGAVHDHWNPRVVADVNDMQVKVVKFRGAFVWHHHDEEDEMFLVVRGTLRMRFRDREALVRPGEFIVVPRGVEHLPVAEEEVHALLFERATTLNTGNVREARTRPVLERL